MPSEYIKNHPAYRYAKAIVSGDFTSMAIIPEIKDIYKPPTYVIKQCRDFLQVADGENPDFCINEHKCRQIDGLLKLLIMPRGLQFGKPLYECTVLLPRNMSKAGPIFTPIPVSIPITE